MNKLKLLIVEGNTKEENINFNNAGCVPQSQNFKKHIQRIEPSSEIDIVDVGFTKQVHGPLNSQLKLEVRGQIVLCATGEFHASTLIHSECLSWGFDQFKAHLSLCDVICVQDLANVILRERVVQTHGSLLS